MTLEEKEKYSKLKQQSFDFDFSQSRCSYCIYNVNNVCQNRLACSNADLFEPKNKNKKD